jgi:hypothetical protein
MIRTQVSLDPADYELVKQQSRDLGISIAEVIRRAVRDTLPFDKSRPWMRYSGFVESGDPQASLSIDEVVYGAKD